MFDHAKSAVDSRVHQRNSRDCAQPVETYSGFVVVEAGKYHSGRLQQRKRQRLPKIAVMRVYGHTRIKLSGTSRHTLSFLASDIAFPKQYRPREIAYLYQIEIEDVNLADAQEHEILDNLIPQRPSADNNYT